MTEQNDCKQNKVHFYQIEHSSSKIWKEVTSEMLETSIIMLFLLMHSFVFYLVIAAASNKPLKISMTVILPKVNHNNTP